MERHYETSLQLYDANHLDYLFKNYLGCLQFGSWHAHRMPAISAIIAMHATSADYAMQRALSI